MPKLELHNLKDTTNPQSKQIQFLENKVNRLRWVNDDLNKQVFNAVQRGHRLAAKLGYEDLNAAEAALATQAGGEASQLEQLSQRSSEELASHVQALQSELVSHVHLSKTTLSALEDALAELSVMREENEKLREELAKARVERKSEDAARKGRERQPDPGEVPSSPSKSVELAFVQAEFAALQDKYAALRKAKQESDDKHAKDYRQWKEFKQWFCSEELKKAERHSKRRKLNPPGDEEEQDDITLKVVDNPKGKAYDRVRRVMASGSVVLSKLPPLEPISSPAKPSVLASRNLNSSSSSPPFEVATPSKPGDIPFLPLQLAGRNPSVVIPSAEMPGSSDTESDSQPVGFLYPSQLNVTEVPPTVPLKRPRRPGQDSGSSDTEAESQSAVTFLFPSQIVPLTPAQVSGMTFKPSQDIRRAQQPLTPVSVVRPQAGKLRRKSSPPAGMLPPPSSPSTRDSFHRSLRAASESKGRIPETPTSRPVKKGKERATENDENAPSSTNAASSAKTPGDYSIYKGRGRYGPQAQAAKQTINAMFEIDPGRNGGVDFQFEEVVRDKEKRKGMHGGDCECCRDYYNAIGTLPARPKAPMWRSPESSPSKKPVRISFEDGGDVENETTAIKHHKNAISRHRQQWERAKTPPGYWNIGFPSTQEVAAMNAEAARMHERKRAVVAEEAEALFEFSFNVKRARKIC
ncbi:hypothetical protein GSI_09226 [Ganoderma sinense ZZ0214-1]|uniref:DNA endonuclease activator Ctp1 C-terminal domain-containing protein n=1 Tax=Ganoderma sinense ZZ0214-1 TaxID=1077348 RepID=A0A2G8S611_9APHY|nr:hypothetical protein GSI_09226 [Ganoderma sinense ZZ0214-1]